MISWWRFQGSHIFHVSCKNQKRKINSEKKAMQFHETSNNKLTIIFFFSTSWFVVVMYCIIQIPKANLHNHTPCSLPITTINTLQLFSEETHTLSFSLSKIFINIFGELETNYDLWPLGAPLMHYPFSSHPFNV